jgi:hypothetical protein
MEDEMGRAYVTEGRNGKYWVRWVGPMSLRGEMGNTDRILVVTVEVKRLPG